MKKLTFILSFAFLFSASYGLSAVPDSLAAAPEAAAGRAMTLDECMAYAVAHSSTVQQQLYTNANYRQSYIASLSSLVPSISASSGLSTNFGRAIDPETNGYTTTSTLSNSYGISASMPLFAGWSGINTLRAAKVMRLMGVEELQRIRDEVALRTMEAYFDVVYYAESVRMAADKLATSTANVAKGRKQFELGLKSAAEVAELELQQASDDYLLTQQENNLALARITLAERMNWPNDRELEVDTQVAVAGAGGAAAYEEVLAYALDHHPKAVGAGYSERYSRLKFAATKGRQYPSLSFSMGYSTSFFKNIDDWAMYDRFRDQFKNNMSHYFSVSLSIPIFNGLSRRTSINQARNDYRIAREKRQETLRALESEVAQAYQQMLGSGKEFVQASKKSLAAELAYEAVAGKYERGMVSPIDLQTSSNDLLQARSERLRARLQYIVKTRLVEYYNGRPLIRE